MTKTAVAFRLVFLCTAACSGETDPGGLVEPDPSYQPPSAQREPPVAGFALAPVAVAEPRTGTPYEAPAPIWPTASIAELAPRDGAALPVVSDDPQLVGGLPVQIERSGRLASEPGAGAPLRVVVESLSRAATVAAGVDGVLVRVFHRDATMGTTRARLALGYRAFRSAHGGDWASRLALWTLPECALSSPDAPGCRATRLASVNDLSSEMVTAEVSIGEVATTLVMLAADGAGAGGDFNATSLAPSATWTAGGNAGDFSWKYALRAPPALGGPAPEIALGYSSSAVDGRMASTNNQASWIGEGFSWQPGSIERRYGECAEDMGTGANNTEKTGDQCWDTDNASLSLPGHGGELLKDAANPDLWHLRNEDGTRVERKTGAPNGDNNGEWWVATTADGTQYWFGGRAGSNATLTVPVFGNHAGEDCHRTAFKDSSCTQGYRWMLDHVVDPYGNTMSLTYVKETNKYARNNRLEDDTVYDRDGYVQKIEYGTRAGDTGPAPMQVVFDVADRCLSGCATRDAQHWPDVPWDRECTAASCAVNQTSPSFWTTKRLTGVTTRVWGGAAYRDVEAWTLSHSFPTSDQPSLWLDRISHRGLVGGTASIPDITFVGVVLANRVDTDNDQFPAMNRYRIKTINSETGGKLDIIYAAQDCVRGTRVPDQNALHSNGLRCYPVKWTPAGRTSPINDFFHKYVVSDVVEADLSGSSSRVVTHHDYLGAPAWHYSDDDGFISNDGRTWSVWRGYAAVRTTKGDPGEQTSEERRYFRGMHGDKLPTGTRSVTLPAIATGNVPAVNDEDAFAGQVRETITFNGPGGAEVTATVNEPWQSAPTASRTINGSTVHARYLNTAAVYSRTALDGGRGHRTMVSSTVFDGFGMPTQTDDRGDEAVTGDEKCTLTEYVRNTGAWIIDKRAREREFAVPCSRVLAGGLTDDDVIGETRSSYDELAWNAIPTRGGVTRVETLLAYNGGNPSFRTQSASAYDSYGRPSETTDERGNKTITVYQPATGGPVTGTIVTTQLGWVTTTTYEPAWNVPLSMTDSNNHKTEIAYDPFGRVNLVWAPGRDRATKSPSIRHDYLIRNNAPSVVTTQRLNASGGYTTSYMLLDNLLRRRQVQVQDAAGGPGALISDTYYDSVGREVKRHEPYLAATASLQPVPPGTNLFLPVQSIPRVKVKQFDGAGREVASIEKVDSPPASTGGTELRRVTTAYGGDRIDVTPPRGGTATSSIRDARGNVVELRQYRTGHAAGSSSGFDRTVYQFNRKNQLTRITNPAGNTWQHFYDVRGNRIRAIDPDSGTTVTTFNAHNDVTTITDGRGVTTAFTYDSIGRKTTLRDGAATGPKRAEWVYDVLSNGTQVNNRLVKSIRYDGSTQYIKEVLGFTINYQPSSVRYTIPSTEATSGVDGTFSYVYAYRENGSPATTRLPALGDPGLGVETLTYGYNGLGNASSLATSLGATLVTAPSASTQATEYTSLGELAVIHLRHNGGPQADIARTYDVRTRRLQQLWTTRATGPTTVADVRYFYDDLGNVTQLSDIASGDHQCFQSDYLRRLTRAWTPADGSCAADPATGLLGGPAPYWHDYSYDAVGNRTRLLEHETSTGVRDTAYAVPTGSHRLAATSTTDATGTRGRAFTYDAAGHMLTRPGPAGDLQTMTWDAEGRLATVQDATGTTSHVYDPDGTRLLRIDPAGKTLYLPGQELRYTAADDSKKVTRYYSHAGQPIATRTAAEGVVWLSGDHHDTARVTIAAVGQAVSLRRETPFGEIRATQGAWPAAMDKGFVGGTNDTTGLTHLGAREYDPVIGRFISVDPVIDHHDPQQMHGYAYSNNTPITAADPTGLFLGDLWHAIEDNAETLSTITGIAGAVCMFLPPPMQAVGAGLTIASVALGVIDTAKDCREDSQSLDCNLGIVGTAVSLIPGGKAVASGIAAGKNAAKFKALYDLESLAQDAVPKGAKQVFVTTRKVLRDIVKEETALWNDFKSAPYWFFHQDRLTRATFLPWVNANLLGNLMLGESALWTAISSATGLPSRDALVNQVVPKPISSVAQRRTTVTRPVVVPPMPPWRSLAGTIHSPTYHHRHGTGAPDF